MAPSCGLGILPVSCGLDMLPAWYSPGVLPTWWGLGMLRTLGILAVLWWVRHAEAIVGLVGPDNHGGNQARTGETCHLTDCMDPRPRRPSGSYYHDGIGCPRREVLAAHARVEGGECE